MAAKVGIFATILLVCTILLPSLALAYLDNRPESLEHDSRKTDVIHDDDNNNNVVPVANDNDFAIPLLDNETRKERSLKEKKKSSLKKNNVKKSHIEAFKTNPHVEGDKKVGGGFSSIFSGFHVPQTTKEHVQPKINVPHTLKEHVQPKINVPQTIEEHVQPKRVQPEMNVQPTIEEQVEPEIDGQSTIEEQVEPEIIGGLQEGFYQNTCPQAEQIIRDGLTRAFQNDSAIGAAIPRLFLHDCFVNGCDASILLDTTPSGERVEKLAGTNGITVKGYELIDEIKAELEKNCPGVVSCSDTIAYLSRDAFVASGLPYYEVPAGRRDGMVSLEENVVGNLPLPGDTVDKMIALFLKKGLTPEDLVVLIGAHSIGVAHCFNFLYRLDTPQKAQMVDPRLSGVMRFTCTNQMTTLAFDTTTQYKMDHVFYKQLLMKKGLLESDQILAQDIRTRGLVQRFSNDEMSWFNKFGVAMNKLGAIEVLTGNQGQIRKQCRAVNV